MTIITKVIIFFIIVINLPLYWNASNICRYNFALGKSSNIINIKKENTDPLLKNVKYYFYRELNCNNVDLEWNFQRVIDNLKTISLVVYQELSTDIIGN